MPTNHTIPYPALSAHQRRTYLAWLRLCYKAKQDPDANECKRMRYFITKGFVTMLDVAQYESYVDHTLAPSVASPRRS